LLRVSPNKKQMKKELDKSWSILAEAIQTVLRKAGDSSAYDKMKKLTRGKALTKETYLELVAGLDLSEKEKKLLLGLTPHTYLGEIEKILGGL